MIDNPGTVENKDVLFIKDVISHYTKYGRSTLVWRKNITAYKVLVSEIMLQQTQVNRVIPKFSMWMKLYPSLSELKKATLTDILFLWQGLGYQRRAKALLSIGKQHRTIPRTFEGLMSLPGVGTYTASAISAFAYNRFDHPVLETNIRTVLIEYFHIHKTNINDAVLYQDLYRLEKNSAVKKIGAREWYYALMDFGAHLKASSISHNTKSAHAVVQSPYKGSRRELRAKVLFAVAQQKKLPEDARLPQILDQLSKEKFILKKKERYVLSKE
jgi:A/G-specific adenine glycosylase